MSLWELNACRDGFEKAHGGKPTVEPPTEEQHEALVEKYRHV